MSVLAQTTDTATNRTVLALLEGVLAVVLEMTWIDDPIDLDEVFRVVADGHRTDPGDGAVVRAKAALDAMAIYTLSHAGPADAATIDAYLGGNAGALYDRLRYLEGVNGIVGCLRRTIEVQRMLLVQPPLWSAV